MKFEKQKYYSIPVYTFAEDFVVDTGYYLMLAGNEISVNPFSVVGCIGRSYKTLVFNKLWKSLDISYDSFTTHPKDRNPYNLFRT